MCRFPFLFHQWGWPRRREGVDKQICLRCTKERVSKYQHVGSELERNITGRLTVTAIERQTL